MGLVKLSMSQWGKSAIATGYTKENWAEHSDRLEWHSAEKKVILMVLTAS